MTPLGVPTQGRVGWPKKCPLCPLKPAPPSAHRTKSFFSGGARSPARFAPPRGRGGDRSVPGPQGLPRAGRTARARGRGRVGAPPAHVAPGEGSARGAGPPTCLRRSKTEEGRGLHCAPQLTSAPTRSFVRRGLMGPGTIRCLAHSALPMLDEAVRLVRLAVIRSSRLSFQPLCAWR